VARKNSNAGGRRFDTRITFRKMCRLIGVTTKQRIMIIKYLKEGEQKK